MTISRTRSRQSAVIGLVDSAERRPLLTDAEVGHLRRVAELANEKTAIAGTTLRRVFEYFDAKTGGRAP